MLMYTASRGFCNNIFLVIFLKQNIFLLRILCSIYKGCLRHFTPPPLSLSVEGNLVSGSLSCPLGYVTGKWEWIWRRGSSLARLAFRSSACFLRPPGFEMCGHEIKVYLNFCILFRKKENMGAAKTGSHQGRFVNERQLFHGTSQLYQPWKCGSYL